MDFDTIFMLGSQGSGKGTQGRLLAEKLGFFYWDMGAILREISKEDTPLGKEVSVIDQGVFLTDEQIIRVAKERLATISPTQGIIFDGLPRRLGQAQFLLDFLKGQKRKKPVSIFLDLPREEAIHRMQLRAQKEGRADDTPEGIEARLHFFEEVIRPIIEYLKTESTFITIDGRPSVPEIEKNIAVALGLN